MARQTILVTGAAGGMGLAFARHMAGNGYRVCLLDRDEIALDQVLRSMRADGFDVEAHAADVADEEGMAVALERCLQGGPLHGVAAFAGVAASAPAEELTVLQWSTAIDSSLKGSFVTSRAAFPYMRAAGSGSIVLVGSTASLGGFAARANYSAAKSGLVGLAKTLSIEWGQYGIRVNLVAPGSIWTERAARAIPEVYGREVIVDRTPLGRHGRPEEVVSAVAFLLSEEASFITGVVLPVDGGLSAGYLTHESGADRGGLS